MILWFCDFIGIEQNFDTFMFYKNNLTQKILFNKIYGDYQRNDNISLGFAC